MEKLVVLLRAGLTAPDIPGVAQITAHLRQWMGLREHDTTNGLSFIGRVPHDVRDTLLNHLGDQFSGVWSEPPNMPVAKGR